MPDFFLGGDLQLPNLIGIEIRFMIHRGDLREPLRGDLFDDFRLLVRPELPRRLPLLVVVLSPSLNSLNNCCSSNSKRSLRIL